MRKHQRSTVRVFAALFFATATAMLGLGIIAPILPLYAKQFSASGLEIGLVFAAFSASRFLFGPFVGRLSDRIGRKSLILVGLGIYTGISVLYAFAGSLWGLGFLRFVQGIGSVMVIPLAQAYVGDMTPRGREGRYMNSFYASQFLGTAVGPLLGGTIGAAWSYEAAFLVMGGLSLLSLVLVSATVPVDQASTDRKLRKRREILPLRHVLTNDAVKAIAVYVAARGFWRQSFNTFFPLFGVAFLGANETSIGIVLSANMFGECLLQVPFGFLADRRPRIPQIIIGSVFPPFMILMIPLIPTMWGVATLAFVMGAFSALGRASLVAIRTEIGRTHGMATLGGLQGSSFALGQMLGPLAGGVVSDALGLAAVFPLGGITGFAGTGLVLLWIRRWLRRDADAPRMALRAGSEGPTTV